MLGHHRWPSLGLATVVVEKYTEQMNTTGEGGARDWLGFLLQFYMSCAARLTAAGAAPPHVRWRPDGVLRHVVQADEDDRGQIGCGEACTG
jgi:hypothetical protein